MALKVPTFFIPRPSKIYPNLDIWFENIPSGNPGTQTYRGEGICLTIVSKNENE
jgi:hypothetical protein